LRSEIWRTIVMREEGSKNDDELRCEKRNAIVMREEG
jgi:hypothetical protein